MKVCHFLCGILREDGRNGRAICGIIILVTDILYFSGTGNSKHVAQCLAQDTEENCISTNVSILNLYYYIYRIKYQI